MPDDRRRRKSDGNASQDGDKSDEWRGSLHRTTVTVAGPSTSDCTVEKQQRLAVYMRQRRQRRRQRHNTPRNHSGTEKRTVERVGDHEWKHLIQYDGHCTTLLRKSDGMVTLALASTVRRRHVYIAGQRLGQSRISGTANPADTKGYQAD